MTDDPRRHDDELRRLLHGAVDDVHPHGTAADIRRRSDEGDPPMTSISGGRWLPLSLAAAAAMVLVIGGTLWLTNGTGGNPEPPVAGPSSDSSSSASTSTSPSPSSTPSSSTSSPSPTPPSSESPDAATHSEAIPVYYLGQTLNGPRLFREFQRAEVCSGSSCAVSEAVDRAVAAQPQDADYGNPWPALTRAGASIESDGTIQVSFGGDPQDDLRTRPAGMSEMEARMAVQQVIYTAQAAAQDRAPVRFLIFGHRTDSLLGVPATEPLTQGDPDSTLAPVQISSPTEGATVPGTFTVTGQAAAFEANVQWELRQGDRVVKKGFTTARECCTLAPYTFTVEGVAPGDYTLVVHDDDASGQGRVNTDTKDITVE